MTNPNFINHPIVDLSELQAIPGKIYRLRVALYSAQSALDGAIQGDQGRSQSYLDYQAKICLGRRAKIARLKQEYEFGMALLQMAKSPVTIPPKPQLKMEFASTAPDRPSQMWEALREFQWKRGPVTAEFKRQSDIATSSSSNMDDLTIADGPGKVPLQSLAEGGLTSVKDSAQPLQTGFIQSGGGGTGIDAATIGSGGAGGVSTCPQPSPLWDSEITRMLEPYVDELAAAIELPRKYFWGVHDLGDRPAEPELGDDLLAPT